jgi:hypothetical protein
MDSLRISDADREAAVDVLAEHYATGRLDKDEFDERSDAVWSAKTRGDLAPVFADLPLRSPARAGRAPARRAGARRPRLGPIPLVPLLIALVVLLVALRLPFLLLLVVLFFVFGRMHHGCRPRRS